MIEARNLSKRFGTKLAVDDLTFTVTPGKVTGLLGPNGAGKSTTMRLIVGLDHPTAGSVTVNGRPYAQLDSPMTEVGALLDARGVDGGRTARQHLRWLARAGSLPPERVEAMIGLVGLTDAANRKIKGFSLGMMQRLSLASALMGDPPVLLLDEPMNGLDPEGIRWVRTTLKALAAEGRTVVVSSHLMSEMELMADHVLVMGRGRLVADASTRELSQKAGVSSVRVASPSQEQLTALLGEAGATVSPGPEGDGALEVSGMDNAAIGQLAAANGVVLHELTPRRASLESTFMELTHDSVEYRSSTEEAGS